MAWIKSFLSYRLQAVKVAVFCKFKPVTSGVIRGSVPGSLFFIICIDSLLNAIDIPTFAYVDNFKFVANLSQYSHVQVQRNIIITNKLIIVS